MSSCWTAHADGDFNAKTGTATLEIIIYKKHIGIYGKEQVNCDCNRLLEQGSSKSLKLTKTFLKHKQGHRSRWELPFKISQSQNISRKSPYRNQIDYVRIKYKPNVTP